LRLAHPGKKAVKRDSAHDVFLAVSDLCFHLVCVVCELAGHFRDCAGHDFF
jgi:hypothetical protein